MQTVQQIAVQEKAFQHEKLMAGSTNERSILLYSDEDGVHRLRGLDKKFDSAQLQVFEEIHASESGLKNFIELSYFHFEYESTQITSPGTLPAPPGAPSGRGRKPETAATVNSRLKRDNEYRDKLKRYQEELQRAVVGNTPGGSRLLDPWLAIENKLASVGVLASIGHKLRRNLGRYVEINSFSWTPEIHMPQSSDRTTDDDYQSKCSDKIANYKEWVVKQEDAHPEGLFVPRGWKDNLRIRNQAADKDKFVPWLYMKRSQYKRDAMGVFAAREFPPWTLVGFISGKVLLKAAEKGTVFPDSDIDQVAQLVKSHSGQKIWRCRDAEGYACLIAPGLPVNTDKAECKEITPKYMGLHHVLFDYEIDNTNFSPNLVWTSCGSVFTTCSVATDDEFVFWSAHPHIPDYPKTFEIYEKFRDSVASEGK